MKKVVLFLAFILLASTHIKAQEVIFPLSSNQTIKEYLQKNPGSISLLRTGSSPDTLSLPFIDDFSKPVGIYPDATLWLDSGAFINSTFCDNPVTVGVATLDGIDKYGNPYDAGCSGSCTSIICDYLTSKPINLSGLTSAENVYFSFYYQPQGLGDEPETGDSLVLQFFGKQDTSWVWQSVWNHDGSSNTAFKRVNISIADSNYLDSAFQFRFLNYATPNGNRDHWNIDYVFLNKNRSGVDSLDGLIDVGFINQPTSFLKDYQSIPWSHYKSLSPSPSLFISSVKDSIRNIWRSDATLTDSLKVYDVSGDTLPYSFTPVIPNSVKNSVKSVIYSIPSNFSFTANGNSSAEFVIKNFFEDIGTKKDNDTTYYTQKFDNYYAYDDGSAEAAYGISVAYAKMAYQFDLKMEDTLRGIQVYFNPWGKNVQNELIQVCLWDSINVASNYENLVYKQINMKVTNIDSINGFTTYVFNTSKVVSGRIYVGLIQNTADLLGIGVDVNTNTGDKMFINYNNYWYQSAIPGSWMIRPLFGEDLRLGIAEQNGNNNGFDIYPNPAEEMFTVYGLQFTVGATLDIYNVLGEKVYGKQLQQSSKLKSQTTVDVSNLPNGIYFVKLSDGGIGSVKRLIVQH